jgi:hypothetical protein
MNETPKSTVLGLLFNTEYLEQHPNFDMLLHDLHICGLPMEFNGKLRAIYNSINESH